MDEDVRQVFKGFRGKIDRSARKIIEDFPDNRLMPHHAELYAALRLPGGEEPEPWPLRAAAHVLTCNARCIGCISQQEEGSKICAPPVSATFTPTPEEVVEIMRFHVAARLKSRSFLRQGCEGEPLTAPLLIESVRRYREAGGHGTINLNSNSSRPQAIAELAEAGLTSLRVSLNSARPEVYERYYRPHGYTFGDVRQSIIEARSRGVHVAVNLLYFPGITDTEEEIEALIELFQSTGISLVQLRNLNIDPEFYPSLLEGISFGPSVGLNNFRKRIRRACPWITYGYFNPYLGDKADLGDTPMPGEWKPAPLEVSEAEEESGN
ncbi:MAG: radical SAM protein [Bilophila wadsworthia]